ncbi:hypothetical protein BH10PSE9_BH10PSE9_14130 [soil metagenome]
MSETKPETLVDGLPIKQWRKIRKEAGRKINPATAEVKGIDAQTLDPYGIFGDDLPKECDQVDREYFARAPESVIWISFRDLPSETAHVLWKMHGRQLWDIAELHLSPEAEARLLDRLEKELPAG